MWPGYTPFDTIFVQLIAASESQQFLQSDVSLSDGGWRCQRHCRQAEWYRTVGAPGLWLLVDS